MQLLLLAVGQRLPAWADDATADLVKRFPADLPLALKTVKAEPRTTGKTPGQMMAAEAQRLLANEAVHAFLYQPQWITVAHKGLRGLWKDVPIFANDLSALRWE